MGDRLVDGGGILFIGVGAMGEPMAARLAAAGYRLGLADAAPGRAKAVADQIRAEAVAYAAPDTPLAGFRTVILMLPASPMVEAVLEGEPDLLARLAPGTVVIDMSSSSPASTRRLAGLAAARGLGFLDAPVSGGVPKARTGELSIMVGGDEAVVAARREVLGAMGSVVTHIGGPGSGHAMKALNNLLSAIGLVGAAEVLSLAARFGIDPRVALDVLNASTGRNQATEVKYGRYVFSGAFDSGFAMKLMVKDLRTAIEIAHDAGVPVPVSAGALEEWLAAFAIRGEQADHTEIAAYVAGRAGVDFAQSPVAEAAADSSETREAT
ncbi:MAG TPA: NAD(P)-dependent oxidoreductase [Natronosporangium sp.]